MQHDAGHSSAGFLRSLTPGLSICLGVWACVIFCSSPLGWRCPGSESRHVAGAILQESLCFRAVEVFWSQDSVSSPAHSAVTTPATSGYQTLSKGVPCSGHLAPRPVVSAVPLQPRWIQLRWPVIPSPVQSSQQRRNEKSKQCVGTKPSQHSGSG